MVRLPSLPLFTTALLLPSLALTQSTTLSPTPPPPSTSSTSSSPEIACNNSPALCPLAYNNITHLGAHNSAFLRDPSTSNSIAGNQFYNATLALSSGLRLLQAQVHLHNNVLELCHSLCELLDAGSLQDWLSKIKHWLDTNPNEVITLLLVNADNQPITSFGDAFQSSGISEYGFIPSNTSSGAKWPVLSDMISSNQRLVTFITGIDESASHPYLLSEFNHVFETPFNITSPSQFACALDRPSSAGTASSALQNGLLPLMNHFMYIDLTSGIQIPNVDSIDKTNSPSLTVSNDTTGSLGRHAELCSGSGQWGQKPVFVLVDFFNRGPAMETGDRLNGIEGKAVGRTPLPVEGSGSATADASGGRGDMKMNRGAFAALVGFLGVALLVL
ncbi:PLC-like phosphodiesterase [Triangularia verruculosa]|uniref:PLC-like phosphodiesterase n=1 Tax=Triangularia verruculosa TaxID=2587418 RepID=A0AAN6XVI4_9PEZI|nr:PLC-like phosphodiesterase [Triangularia verruculosa]